MLGYAYRFSTFLSIYLQHCGFVFCRFELNMYGEVNGYVGLKQMFS